MRVETAAAAKDVVVCHNMEGAAGVLLVCEHASRYIPSGLNGLGLSPAHLDSHAVWDPGAMAVATHMANLLDARLVAGAVSRLVYDCNRAPGAVDAMPARSERVDVPGNAALSTVERARRLAEYYTPFHDAVAGALATMTTNGAAQLDISDEFPPPQQQQDPLPLASSTKPAAKVEAPPPPPPLSAANSKRAKTLRKKLHEIAELEGRVADGAVLPANQKAKVAAKSDISAELASIDPSFCPEEGIADCASGGG